VIADPELVGPAIGVDPANPRLAGVCAAADDLVLAYLDTAAMVDPAPPAVVEAATQVASHIWHLPDLPSGSGGSGDTGTLDLGGDVYTMVRSLLWPYRGSVGIL
jgi:hypothetical protein